MVRLTSQARRDRVAGRQESDKLRAHLPEEAAQASLSGPALPSAVIEALSKPV